jgi:hypothetical protein
MSTCAVEDDFAATENLANLMKKQKFRSLSKSIFAFIAYFP